MAEDYPSHADLQTRVRAAYDPDSRYQPEDLGDEPLPTHPLDTEESLFTLRKLESWYDEARLIQGPNREQQAIDEDFYDGLQWTDEDREALQSRGQAPLVFNLVKPAVDWVTGTERRTRLDWRVYPRSDDDSKAARTKTKLLKYVADVNRVQFNRSRAFADAARVGVGWLEDGLRSDPTAEPLMSAYVNWRHMWYDPYSTALDLSDARYVIREKWTDLDTAIGMFPERAEALKSRAVNHSTPEEELHEWQALYGSSLYQHTDLQGYPISDNLNATTTSFRARVKLLECWYRQLCTCRMVMVDPMHMHQVRELSMVHGMDYDETDDLHAWAVKRGYASLRDALRQKVWCAIFTHGVLLQHMASPYRHNRFPFTAIWGYRRGRDQNAYGLIRQIRDPQEDLNKRRSKALHVLSTNRVIAEKGAFDDKEVIREEAAAPDGVMEYNRGYQFQLDSDKSLTDAHIALERSDSEYIHNVSGVTAENQGQQTNASSGKAIMARQNQGSVVTTTLFDNLRQAVQHQGEIQLSLIEQFYSQPKVVRITDDRGEASFEQVNMPDESGEILNDITATKADFVIGEQNWSETVRQAMFEQMVEMVGKLPGEVALQLLDLVVEMSDVPGKEEMVQRIRRINGHIDPSKIEDPENRRQAEEQQAARQQQQQLAAQQAVSEIQEKIAQAKERQAKADKTQAEVEQTKIETYEKVMELAQQILQAPDAAPAAEEIQRLIRQTELAVGETTPSESGA